MTLLSCPQVLLELRPELADGVFHRPARTVRQTANRRAGHDADLVADFFENLQILQPALALAQAVGHLQHPTGPLAAGRTLAARLMGEKPTNIVQNVNDAGFLVEHRDRSRAKTQTADLAGAVEVERHVELGL